MSQYGWFILLGSVLLLYIWYKLQPRYEVWRKKQRDKHEDRNYGKNLYDIMICSGYLLLRTHLIKEDAPLINEMRLPL